MKPAIFDERVAVALKNWHQTAKKHVKRNKGSVSGTPYSSQPGTPSHNMSPVHLLRNYRSEMESVHTSPRRSNFEYDTDSPSQSYTVRYEGGADGSMSSRYRFEYDRREIVGDVELGLAQGGGPVQESGPSTGPVQELVQTQHVIEIGGPSKEFSFDKRNSI